MTNLRTQTQTLMKFPKGEEFQDAKVLARKIIENQIGETPDSFWNKPRKEFTALAIRAEYIPYAKLAYSSPTLWILQGYTNNRWEEGRRFSWEIEIHRPTKLIPQGFAWVFGLEGINGGR